MRKLALAVMAGFVLCLAVPAMAEDNCPVSVRAAVEKTFPGSTVKRCEVETEHGKQVYEVKLKTKDGHTSKMDIDPSGLVLVTNQYVATTDVPVVVMKTYQGKYANYKVVRTEKLMYPDGKVTYRIVYAKDNGKRAVIYTPEGTFVEEIETVVDDDMD